MKNPLRIAGLGEVLWDIYGEKRHPGGAPANFALHVQRLGHQGILLSRVGSDELGRELLSRLRKEGLDLSGVQIDPHRPTGTVQISLDEQGVPRFTCSNDVAFDYFEPFDAWLERAGELDALLFGTLAQRNPVSRRSVSALVARHPAKRLVFDVNLRGNSPDLKEIIRQGLLQAQLVKVNEEELRALQLLLGKETLAPETFARWLLETFELELVTFTLGPAGAVGLSRKEMLYTPGFRVVPVDTTGAGDAFAAGLVVKLLEGESLAEALEFANALAALVATRHGAVPQYRPGEADELRCAGLPRNVREEFRPVAVAGK